MTQILDDMPASLNDALPSKLERGPRADEGGDFELVVQDEGVDRQGGSIEGASDPTRQGQSKENGHPTAPLSRQVSGHPEQHEPVEVLETLTGDPLKDLPPAEEGGARVAVAHEAAPELDTFMNQYGIDTTRGNRGGFLLLGLPSWLQWASEAWEEALALSVDEDEANTASSAFSGGFKVRLRILSMGSVDGRVPQGTLQVALSMFRHGCKVINRTAVFGNVFGILIVVNTIYMGFQVDYNWEGIIVDTIDQIFVTLFFIEIIIRIAATDTFASGGNGFLYFDTAIVGVSVIDMWIIPLLFQDWSAGMDMHLIQGFRIMRITRLVRLLRLVPALHPLRLLERSMRRGSVHFASIVLFLTSYLYATSLLIITQVKKTETSQIFKGSTDYVGTGVLRLMAYLFESIICGFDWSDKLMKPLTGESNTRALGGFLLFFMFCSKIALTNLITASLVENYLATVNVDAIEEKNDIYRALDMRGFKEFLDKAEVDGRVSWTEFVKLARTHEDGPKFLKLLGIDAVATSDEHHLMGQLLEMRKVFVALDLAGEESIPVEAFALGYVKLKKGQKDLHALIFDVLLRKVMFAVRAEDTCIVPMQMHMTHIEGLLAERLQSFKYMTLDVEESLSPIDASLSRLEEQFAVFDESLKLPDETTKVVPDAAASFSSMSLHAEVEALKKAAEGFIKAHGLKVDSTRALANVQHATANDLPPSTYRQTDLHTTSVFRQLYDMKI